MYSLDVTELEKWSSCRTGALKKTKTTGDFPLHLTPPLKRTLCTYIVYHGPILFSMFKQIQKETHSYLVRV